MIIAKHIYPYYYLFKDLWIIITNGNTNKFFGFNLVKTNHKKLGQRHQTPFMYKLLVTLQIYVQHICINVFN